MRSVVRQILDSRARLIEELAANQIRHRDIDIDPKKEVRTRQLAMAPRSQTIRRACGAARPSYVPTPWQTKDENAYALREQGEREDAMHETARIGHCCRLRQ